MLFGINKEVNAERLTSELLSAGLPIVQVGFNTEDGSCFAEFSRDLTQEETDQVNQIIANHQPDPMPAPVSVEEALVDALNRSATFDEFKTNLLNLLNV
jgi:hypothetical protein